MSTSNIALPSSDTMADPKHNEGIPYGFIPWSLTPSLFMADSFASQVHRLLEISHRLTESQHKSINIYESMTV